MYINVVRINITCRINKISGICTTTVLFYILNRIDLCKETSTSYISMDYSNSSSSVCDWEEELEEIAVAFELNRCIGDCRFWVCDINI